MLPNGMSQAASALIAKRSVFLLILILAASPIEVGIAATTSGNQSLHRAVAYLRATAYNPDVELCREAPRVAPSVYWVASDNLLASKALEPYDSKLSSRMRSRLVEIAKTYSLPVSVDGVPLSLRYDVVMRDDETLEIPPRDITHITLQNGSYLLRYDVANGTNRFEDWGEYADLLLLVALSNHNRGDHANAVGNFTLAANMWDGMGLRDKAYRLAYGEGQARGSPNAYATYKLGLLLYVAGKLGITLPYEQDVIGRVWSMQNQTSGGVFTHIMADGGSGDSDTNTETTAFVILGMTSIQNRIPEFPSSALVILILGVVLTVSMVSIQSLRHAGAKRLKAA